MSTLTVASRFNGPPGSGNGGVTCGLLAQATGLSQVTLRKPPPLEVAMRLDGPDLYDGEDLVASGAPGTVEVSPVTAVSLKEAALATASYGGWQEHPFPTCFVCGPEHPDGLRLFAGPVGEDVVAAPWTPHDEDPVMVWAALDCPSAWANGDLPGRPLVLGRMTCRVDQLPKAGEDHVVMGWVLGEDGRKVHTASALYTAGGTPLAVAQHTWIALNR